MADDRTVETTVLEALEALGADFEAMEVDPALADTATFCEHYGVAPGDSANCIVVASRDDPPLLAACGSMPRCCAATASWSGVAHGH